MYDVATQKTYAEMFKTAEVSLSKDLYAQLVKVAQRTEIKQPSHEAISTKTVTPPERR